MKQTKHKGILLGLVIPALLLGVLSGCEITVISGGGNQRELIEERLTALAYDLNHDRSNTNWYKGMEKHFTSYFWLQSYSTLQSQSWWNNNFPSTYSYYAFEDVSISGNNVTAKIRMKSTVTYKITFEMTTYGSYALIRRMRCDDRNFNLP
ncbi:MAG: hypothetical protein LBQ61_00705 [Spirochaetales bacterium]|jgi:hypothetical protein|nr:hypothetical protein [Spirochaetales bacterium]